MVNAIIIVKRAIKLEIIEVRKRNVKDSTKHAVAVVNMAASAKTASFRKKTLIRDLRTRG